MRFNKLVLIIFCLMFIVGISVLISQEITPISRTKTNIIKNKPVFASTSYSPTYPVYNAIDGNLATVWGTGAGNATDYIYADFGQPMAFDEVVIRWYAEYYASHFQIWVSDDAKNWRQIVDVPNNDGSVDILNGSDTCRYFGLLFLDRNMVAIGVSEIEVFKNGPDIPVIEPGNISYGKTATASSSETAELGAENAVDGDETSRWASAETDEEWITIDLGKRYLLETVDIRWEAAFAEQYNVNISDDGSSWVTAFTESYGDGGLDRVTFSSDQAARYIQVEGIKRGTLYGYSIFEIQTYCDGHTPAKPTQTPTPTATLTPTPTGGKGPVAYNGQLKVIGTKLCNQFGQAIQLRGMSSHGMQWFGDEINDKSLDVLAYDWQIDIMRLSLYAREGGFETDPNGWISYMENKIDMAIARGVYVLIDWHQLSPGDPWADVDNAEWYLTHMASRYKDSPAVIYEICNEPNRCSWENVRTYAEYMIPKIRAIDPDGVIFVGTHGWGSLGISDGGSEWDIINNPVYQDNIMYSFHFYAASHGQIYRDAVENFVNQGFPLFVTECGTQEASGDGPNDFWSSDLYFDLLEQYQIGFCNWNFSSDFRTGAVLQSSGDYYNLKEAGYYIKDRIQNPPSPWDYN